MLAMISRCCCDDPGAEEEFFVHPWKVPTYVNDGTNDLMDLSILRGIGGCEARGESGRERPLERLERAHRGAEGRRTERPLEAATSIELAPSASPIGFLRAAAYLFSIV